MRRRTVRWWASIGALNLMLAAAFAAAAPDEPKLSDRSAYDLVGAAPLAPDCPVSIYCYRVLVPAVLHRLPIEPGTGWRAHQVSANAAAGVVMAAVTAGLAGGVWAPVLASAAAHASYGFAFTAYDPYTPDPLVFLLAALLVWCWTRDRPGVALALCAAGIFAKESVGLLAAALAVAALVDRRPGWQRWLAPVLASGVLLAAFHAASRLWLDWEIASNPATRLADGSWLGLWWRNNPFLERKLYMVFAVFGFAWVFAAFGWRLAPARWRALALGTILPMLLLAIIQTPERALANAYFVVIPLAVLFAGRVPALGVAALGLNALVTAKAGTSSLWLPSARLTLIPAALAAAWLLWQHPEVRQRLRGVPARQDPVI